MAKHLKRRKHAVAYKCRQLERAGGLKFDRFGFVENSDLGSAPGSQRAGTTPPLNTPALGGGPDSGNQRNRGFDFYKDA